MWVYPVIIKQSKIKNNQKSFLKQEIIWQTCYGLPKIRKSQTMSKEIEEKVLNTFLVSNQKFKTTTYGSWWQTSD